MNTAPKTSIAQLNLTISIY